MTDKQVEWQRANPEKVRAAKARYRAKPETRAKERKYRDDYKKRPEVKAREKAFMSSAQRLAWRREYRRVVREKNYIKYMVARIKQRAKVRGLEMTLTETDIPIPEFCPVLGVKLVLSGDRWALPSIDRLDNSRGYVPGNVRVISRKANALKSDATIAELEAVLAYMRREGCP